MGASSICLVQDFIEGLDKGRPLLYRPWALYDFDLFKEHGYCFVHRLPERHVALIKHTAYKIFRILPANVSRPYHLLKPSLRVDKEIKKMLRVLPENFTAVHRRIKMYTLFDCNRKGKGQNFTKPPFCWIRSEYVRQAQAENNITVPDPVFLATDTPKVCVLPAPQWRFKATFGCAAVQLMPMVTTVAPPPNHHPKSPCLDHPHTTTPNHPICPPPPTDHA